VACSDHGDICGRRFLEYSKWPFSQSTHSNGMKLFQISYIHLFELLFFFIFSGNSEFSNGETFTNMSQRYSQVYVLFNQYSGQVDLREYFGNRGI
jgi:hypothetical protein